ncbi:unnamed protein product [Notodromas monacha]|uniref:Uncharacterized protein n=1 Tax=Notodromas monacha TaxID=399045 RepID=A0A7R9BTS8_9CRUS|nr:unnamed protein product [Notodromas monacha]CAG0921282.1 unnamed protein product [Notodromas monacha]
MAGQDLMYLHVQGEMAGANAIYGLDEVSTSKMPAEFWAEFPQRRGLRPKSMTTSQVLNRLGAWGFRLAAFAPAADAHAENLARLFYPNSIYLRPVSKYFPMFYWILCRNPTLESSAESDRGNQLPIKDGTSTENTTASSETQMFCKI